MKTNKVLVLRTCANNMTDYCGLIWPTSGLVECKFWEPTIKLENGLTGALWGQDASAQLSMQADAKWVVCEVAVGDLIFLEDDEGVKFSRADVVHVGTRSSALDYISDNAAKYEASTKNLVEEFVAADVSPETRDFLSALPVSANNTSNVLSRRTTIRNIQSWKRPCMAVRSLALIRANSLPATAALKLPEIAAHLLQAMAVPERRVLIVRSLPATAVHKPPAMKAP